MHFTREGSILEAEGSLNSSIKSLLYFSDSQRESLKFVTQGMHLSLLYKNSRSFQRVGNSTSEEHISNSRLRILDLYWNPKLQGCISDFCTSPLDLANQSTRNPPRRSWSMCLITLKGRSAGDQGEVPDKHTEGKLCAWVTSPTSNAVLEKITCL